VDTSAAESVEIDSLGRRTGPRRQHTIEENLRIVKETHVRGASVATVARRYNCRHADFQSTCQNALSP